MGSGLLFRPRAVRVTGEACRVGKPAGKRRAEGKMTYENPRAPVLQQQRKAFAGGCEGFIKITTLGEYAGETCKRPSEHAPRTHRRVAHERHLLPKCVLRRLEVS